MVPVVDLNKYKHGDASQKKEFVKELAEAFHNVGFVTVANHGIDQGIIDDFYAASKAFFSLDPEQKSKYELPGLAGQRGYTSFGKEHAKQSKVADLKEFFQFGQEIHDDQNPEIAEIPNFREIGMKLYRAFEETGGYLLEAIAIHLDLPKDYFRNYTKEGLSILRSIYYPPITEEPESAIRAEQHEDINLITLLVGASAGGLQLLNMDNEWVEVRPAEDQIAVNVGDMLQRLTNNYLKSTTHRVVNPPRELWHTPRLSIPFFLHPVAEMNLACLEDCITDERPKAYEDATAGEYLDERLREIGLKK